MLNVVFIALAIEGSPTSTVKMYHIKVENARAIVWRATHRQFFLFPIMAHGLIANIALAFAINIKVQNGSQAATGP